MFTQGSNRICSPELLAKVVDVLDSAVLITRFGNLGQFDHKIVYANAAFTRLTGYSANDLIGRSPDVLCDPRTGAEKMLEFYSSCRRGENFSLAVDSFRKQGEGFTLNLSVSQVLDDMNGASFFIVNCRDNAQESAQPQAEAQNENHHFTFETQGAANGFNVNAANAETGGSILITAQTAANKTANLQASGNAIDEPINDILRQLKKDPIFSQSYSLTEEEQQRELENLQAQANAKPTAEIADEEAIAEYCKTQFLANMSHDLRTPLNAIIGFSEVIKDQLFGPIENPRYVSYARDIYRSGQELLTTISEIMELSEINPESEKLEEEKLNISEVIESVLDVLSPKAFESDVRITKSLEAKDLRFLGDRRKLKQAFAGVLGNAIRYSTKSSKIEITSGISDKGDFRLVVYAKTANILGTKNGIGSLLGTITKKVESEYPEISLARRFIEAHEGKFNIFNSATSGTEITITLPASRLSMESDGKRLFKVIS